MDLGERLDHVEPATEHLDPADLESAQLASSTASR